MSKEGESNLDKKSTHMTIPRSDTENISLSNLFLITHSAPATQLTYLGFGPSLKKTHSFNLYWASAQHP